MNLSELNFGSLINSLGMKKLKIMLLSCQGYCSSAREGVLQMTGLSGNAAIGRQFCCGDD